MDRKTALILVANGAVFISVSLAALGHGNESTTAKTTIGKTTVMIDYRRPALKGRDLMKMIHPGDLWRLGADAPTTIESSSDLDFGGTRVPKGKHVLLARYLEPGKWTLVVSSKDRRNYEPSAKLAWYKISASAKYRPCSTMRIHTSRSWAK